MPNEVAVPRKKRKAAATMVRPNSSQSRPTLIADASGRGCEKKKGCCMSQQPHVNRDTFNLKTAQGIGSMPRACCALFAQQQLGI
jgi:hypothetical protein